MPTVISAPTGATLPVSSFFVDTEALAGEGGVCVRGACGGRSVCGKSNVFGACLPRIPRQATRRGKRKHSKTNILEEMIHILFWNARGIEEEMIELIVLLEECNAKVACIMETKIFGKNLSTKEWKWLAGPETLPSLGGDTPRMGLGFLVHASFVDAAVVRKGKYTAWLCLPGVHVDMYICAVYIPVYGKQKTAALEEIWKGYNKFRHEGVVVLGGDLNARCGANSDTVINTAGRTIMRQCQEEEMSLLNLDPKRCFGAFSREQQVTIAKTKETVVHRTTIDYVLIPVEQDHRAKSLCILDDTGLDSDHKPIMVKLKWTFQPGKVPESKARQFHTRWNLQDMNVWAWNRFEECCDRHMSMWMAQYEERSKSVQFLDAAARLLQCP